MLEMRVVGLTLDERSKTPVVTLQSRDGNIVLPILIGAMEAMSISLALENENLPRPLTHDLLLLCIKALRYSLESAEITRCDAGIYYAILVLHNQTSRLRIDCRPSDAIALALRANAPILLSRTIISQLSENQSEVRHEMPPLVDAATDMVRQAGAQREVSALHNALLRGAGLPREGDPETDEKFKELLHLLEPASRLKM